MCIRYSPAVSAYIVYCLSVTSPHFLTRGNQPRVRFKTDRSVRHFTNFVAHYLGRPLLSLYCYISISEQNNANCSFHFPMHGFYCSWKKRPLFASVFKKFGLTRPFVHGVILQNWRYRYPDYWPISVNYSSGHKIQSCCNSKLLPVFRVSDQVLPRISCNSRKFKLKKKQIHCQCQNSLWPKNDCRESWGLLKAWTAIVLVDFSMWVSHSP